MLLLTRLGGSFKNLHRIWVDSGYRGQLLTWVTDRFRFFLKVVLRSAEQKGFAVLLRRWVVERTFGWLNHNRYLSKDLRTTRGDQRNPDSHRYDPTPGAPFGLNMTFSNSRLGMTVRNTRDVTRVWPT